MNIEQLLFFQIIADVVLCAAIFLLLRAMLKDIKKKPEGVNEKSFSEFRKMLDESQDSAGNLLQAMDECKTVLEEIAGSLNEKEKRLKTLIEQSDIQLEKLNVKSSETGETLTNKKPYDDVIKMARQGLSEEEISKSLSLSEGETHLIIDLDRRKK